MMRMNKIQKRKIPQLIARSLFCLLFLTSCTNGLNGVGSKAKSSLAGGNPSIIGSASTSAYTHHMKTVTITAVAAGGGGTTSQWSLSLGVDTALAGFTNLTNFCNMTGTKPCKCQASWEENNTLSSSTQTFTRTKKMNVTEVQNSLVKCLIDDSLWVEIPSGVTLRMTIVPAGTANTSGLNVRQIGYKKGTSTVAASGDFLDSTLTPFRNIHRYSCFSRKTTSFEVLNATSSGSITTTAADGTTSQTNLTMILGSKFCTGTAAAAGSGSSGTNCSNPRSGYSVQSYYRNLYIPSDALGTINSSNEGYYCPRVQESILYSSGDPAQPQSEQNKYWPLDSEFALATQRSPEYSVGVRAPSVLLKPGDSDSAAPTACVGEDVNQRLLETGIVNKCLGYAKKPLPNGSCGTMVDSLGQVRPLSRLRRFRTIYPPAFNSNGTIQSGPLEGDEVYVMDRVVVDSNGSPTGAMIYGPKPCPFAWFDSQGVVNRDQPSNESFFSNFRDASGTAEKGRPAYVATSEFHWNGQSVNPNGIVFPNFDRSGTPGNTLSPPSCSATLPVITEIQGAPAQVRLVTSSYSRTDSITVGGRSIKLNEVHVRPVDPWTPQYREDTSFQACAPLSNNWREPPMQFYSVINGSDSYMSWCSKPYPTQNPYWAKLNEKIIPQPNPTLLSSTLVNWPAAARVSHYTSHDSTAYSTLNNGTTNSCTANRDTCLSSLGAGDPNYSYCLAYIKDNTARATCDRTVIFDAANDYRVFPLQARTPDIVSALSNDALKAKNYSCTFSVNPADPTKVGKEIPQTGCCGMLPTGSALLSTLLGASGNAHLEPYNSAQFPSVRFCGSPVVP